MIIDSHCHAMLPVEKQINLLQEAGVNKAILFSTIVHPEKATNSTEFREEMNKLRRLQRGEINPVEGRIAPIKELLDVVNSNREMFWGGFGPCPVGLDYENTSKWVESYVVENDLMGIGEITLGPGQVNTTENIFKALSNYTKQYPLWIHTLSPLTLEDIRMIVHFSKAYPTVRVILGHGGGFNWLEASEMVKALKNLFVDLSASYTVFSIKLMAEEFPEKVLFGSDMPYGSPYLTRKAIEYVVKDKTVQKMILGENILRIIDT